MKFFPTYHNRHPSHALTRDGADGLDHWHRCAACGATDAAGDGRLAEPCVRPLAPGDVVTLKSGALTLVQPGKSNA